MNILFIGDIVGAPGRDMLSEYLPKLKTKYQPAMTIINGENAASGKGITPAIAKQFYSSGVQIITLGNHTWDKKEITDYLDMNHNIIRPANFPDQAPGVGYTIMKHNQDEIAVISLQGRVFLPALDCPFAKSLRLIEHIRQRTPIIFVDFHAEATSEKEALGWYLDGTVSAVVGTHTHVQTADERVLPKGTAYITDVGMTGSREGILGFKKEAIIDRFLTAMPSKFEVNKEGSRQLNAVVVTINAKSGEAKKIERIRIDTDHSWME